MRDSTPFIMFCGLLSLNLTILLGLWGFGEEKLRIEAKVRRAQLVVEKAQLENEELKLRIERLKKRE